MIFGDEPRFDKDVQIIHGQLCGFRKNETDKHVGPGSYFAADNEELRSGWCPKSFSRRAPMSPDTRQTDRNYHYTSAVLMPVGLALPGSPSGRQTPGPGYYGKPVVGTPTRRRPQSAGDSFNSAKSSCMGNAHRLASPTAILKDGVLFSSISQNVGVGPGHYSLPDNSILRKSHNVRVSSAPRGGRSSRGTAAHAGAGGQYPAASYASPGAGVRTSRASLQNKLRGST